MNRKLIRAAAAVVGAVLFGDAAFAATTPNSYIWPQTPNRGIVQFLQGTDVAGTYKTLYTGGANGSVCRAMSANTNDASAAHLVTVQLVNAAVKYGGTAVNVPISSGFASGAPPVNLMSATNWPGLPVDGPGNPYFYLASASDTLQATFATALTASAVLNINAVCTDF